METSSRVGRSRAAALSWMPITCRSAAMMVVRPGVAWIGAVTCQCSWSICGSCPPWAIAIRQRRPDRCLRQGQLDSLAADLPLELGRPSRAITLPLMVAARCCRRADRPPRGTGSSAGGRSAAGVDQAHSIVTHISKPACGVKTDGRFIEERPWGAADQAGGEIEPAPHAAGVGLDDARWPASSEARTARAARRCGTLASAFEGDKGTGRSSRGSRSQSAHIEAAYSPVRPMRLRTSCGWWRTSNPATSSSRIGFGGVEGCDDVVLPAPSRRRTRRYRLRAQ